MADTGKTIALIKALGGSADPAAIKAAVEDWLAEHVDPETGYVIDNTLSIANAAADAKKVGDELADVKSAISVLEPTATSADVGKTLVAKTVENGKVTEWEFGEASEVKPDGYYQSMTVGNAEQLVSTVGVEDSAPYNFRTTGGSADVGDRVKLSKITGGTVAWNQLVHDKNDMATASTTSGVTYQWQGQVCTLSGQVDSGAYYSEFLSRTGIPVIAGHKYLVIFENKSSISDKTFDVVFAGGNVPYGEIDNRTGYRMFVANTTGTVSLFYRATQKTASFTATARLPMQYDLTQMFGSTIADYIYALEQANAGAGVAWFKKLFPKPYYAYNAGELMHVQTSGHKMVGFNQWDEEREEGSIDPASGQNEELLIGNGWRSKNYIPVISGATYNHFTDGYNGNFAHFWYDANKDFIGTTTPRAVKSNALFTVPEGASFMRFRFLTDLENYKNCINLSWDGERDGEYEPYEAHTYPLGDVELRGIPKLDADNNLYYDGDTYEADGTVTRKYRAVKVTNVSIGAGACIRNSNGLWCASFYVLSGSNKALPNGSIMCDTITPINKYYGNATQEGVTFTAANTFLAIICLTDATSGLTASSTTSEAATALSAYINAKQPTIVYPLETPTTESADPYQETQICNDFGTEEFIDTRTVPIPVGHASMYQSNLRAKLEMAPDSPADGDGDYIVRQTNGQNAYVKLVIPTELPTSPTEDGEFLLKVTVASGVATLSWVTA